MNPVLSIVIPTRDRLRKFLSADNRRVRALSGHIFAELGLYNMVQRMDADHSPSAGGESLMIEGSRMSHLSEAASSPVIIESIELLRFGNAHLVRSRCTDGVVGLAVTKPCIAYLHPILTDLVAPFFAGRDARELEALVEGVYLHQRNYKLTGPAFWSCVASVEFSLIDLLGKVSQQPVSALLGGSLRSRYPYTFR